MRWMAEILPRATATRATRATPRRRSASPWASGSAPAGRRGRHANDEHLLAPRHTAFVLAGGGSRGAVQVGMLEELVRRGIRADRVFGASVGAINGAAYAGNPTLSGVEHMAEVWRGVCGAEIFPRGAF